MKLQVLNEVDRMLLGVTLDDVVHALSADVPESKRVKKALHRLFLDMEIDRSSDYSGVWRYYKKGTVPRESA